MRWLVLTCVVVLLHAASALALVYKWVDRNGNAHFTDNISRIPAEYRDQVEELAATPPSPQPALDAPDPSPLSSSLALSPPSHTVSLSRIGGSLLVDTVLDGLVKLRLIVDTGADFTVISTASAQRLGLRLDDAPSIPLQSASGPFLAPLAKVRSIAVGGAIAQDVEVIVHDIPSGHSEGLLGMTFLDRFQVTLSTEKKEMALAVLADTAEQVRFGGHSEDWWRRKFRFYRQQVAHTQSFLQKQPSPKFERALRYLQTELAELERKASHAGIPQDWRY